MTRIALIDGPMGPGAARQILCCTPHPRASESPAAFHATQLAHAIWANAPEADIDNYVVFPGKLATSVGVICEAIHQATASEAKIIHCSFGLPGNAPALETAVEKALAAGKQIVASSAARGVDVYPAMYSGVISVQGDARCDASVWSYLDLSHAEFGACPLGADQNMRGASVAAAYFTGLLATRSLSEMREQAEFQGRERRLA